MSQTSLRETELDSYLGELSSITKEIEVHRLAAKTLMSVRDSIIRRMVERGIPQAEVADYLHVTPARISQIVNERVKAT